MKILITGCNGQLGTELQKQLRQEKSELGPVPERLRNATVIAVDVDQLDITDRQATVDFVRRHQPDVIIDNRLETSGEGFGSLVTEQPAYYSGDFVSPEQILPPEGIRNVRGERVPTEPCTAKRRDGG